MIAFLITSHPADIERAISAVKLETGVYAVEPPKWMEPPTLSEIQAGLYHPIPKTWEVVLPYDGKVTIREYRRADGGGRRWGVVL